MKKVILFCLIVSWLIAGTIMPAMSGDSAEKLVINIDYGGVIPARSVEMSLVKDKTVLEVLLAIAQVQTHPVGKYVIVTAIDGVEGRRGDMAWYYTLDGKSPGEVAYTKKADDVKQISWEFKQDVCSKTVDIKN